MNVSLSNRTLRPDSVVAIWCSTNVAQDVKQRVCTLCSQSRSGCVCVDFDQWAGVAESDYVICSVHIDSHISTCQFSKESVSSTIVRRSLVIVHSKLCADHVILTRCVTLQTSEQCVVPSQPQSY